VVGFYQTIGFEVTYRQVRPNPYLCLSAARQGDARGNEAAAIAVLEAGLTRHADATAVERVPVLVYLAELLVRSGDRGRAADVLAELRALELDDAASAEVGEELASASDLEAESAEPFEEGRRGERAGHPWDSAVAARLGEDRRGRSRRLTHH
jgi:hypothetical protein